MAGVDAVVFDLGGVLVEIDFERMFAQWARSAAVPVEHVAARFAQDAAYAAHECGTIDASAYFAALRGRLGLALDDAAFAAGWSAMLVGPMPGAAELLRALNGRRPIHVFSNTNAVHHEQWRRDYADLLAPVDRVFCSYQLGVRKPSPESFAAVCERIGVPAARVLFLDDLADNVAGARAAGLQAARVATVDDSRRALVAAGVLP